MEPTAAVKQTSNQLVVPMETKSLKSESSTRMVRLAIDNISKENSWAKVDLPNVMNLSNVITKQ